VPVPVGLAGGDAYISFTDHLDVVNMASGKLVRSVRPSRPAARWPANAVIPAPTITAVGTRTVALFPFLVNIPGHGTVAATPALQLVAVTAPGSTIAWTAQFPLGAWTRDLPGADLVAAVVGTAGDTVVLRVSDPSGLPAHTYAVTPAGKLLWSSPDSFAAGAVIGDAVAGFAGDVPGAAEKVSVRALGSGQIRRTSPGTSFEVRVVPAGPDQAIVMGRRYDSGHYYFERLGADGRSRPTNVPAGLSPTSCVYDQVKTVVCYNDPPQVIAFDVTSGQMLWSLPDTAANRVAPTVTAVWHGAIYGETGNGAVVLDARSGKDRQDAPGIAPNVVDASYGVAWNPGTHQLMAYPATG
jgi:outer membrane protein assembly factor BamB